jgi:NADH:ubiquinone oxidoreductase subunit 5 (subunit L)/multisubunit Na+/H+ antiporter MnhA subunit
VTAVTLVGLALAWSVAGIALCLLLGVHRESAAARAGVRRTARAFLVGDAALWAAVAVVVIGWGDLDLRSPSPRTCRPVRSPSRPAWSWWPRSRGRRRCPSTAGCR